jgi:uncharacterized protein
MTHYHPPAIASRRAFVLGLGALVACRQSETAVAQVANRASGKAGRLLAAARAQIGVTLAYDPAYTQLRFPGGDVDRAKGVCTDVVIRAYRDALGIDLQALVNADMRASFSAYPRIWGLRATDRNIDHRRVPNLETFLRRAGAALPIPAMATGWRAGDIFTMRVGANLPHIGLISDRIGASGRPLIIHNIGQGTREDDALAAYPIAGHFRWAVAD